MTDTENQIIEVCRELGGIASSNGSFTFGLACLLNKKDESILNLTVKNFLSITREYSAVFNRVHGGDL